LRQSVFIHLKMSNLEQLHSEFPDMSKSTLNDVLVEYKNDRVAATRALKGISEELKRENEQKVQELKEMFPTLSVQIIEAELEACNGNVDAAIAPLFTKVEELSKNEKKRQSTNQRKKKQEEVVKKRKEAANLEANNLVDIFKTIPKEKVSELLDENEGDIEETTSQLLKIVAKQEEDAKKVAKAKADESDKKKKLEQEQRMKELKFQALKDKFEDLTDDQVTSTLTNNDWDIKKALAELYVLSFGKKKKELKDLFQSMTEEEIEMALEENNQDKVRAVKVLTLQREKKRIENQARTMKDAQKRDKRKKSKSKRKQNTSKQSKEPEKAPHIQAPEPETVHDEESDEEEIEEEKKAPAPFVSKVRENALQQSMIVGEAMEKEIVASHIQIIKEEAVLQKQATEEVFRETLENIIGKQARNNTLPGMVPPPLPKQIDAILNKTRPVVEIEQVNVSITEKELPQPTHSTSNSSIHDEQKALINLTVKNSVIDIGNPIVVDWEITSGVSSAWDWIGLFPVGKSNKQYVTYQWSGKQLIKGSLNFIAPNEYGEYEFRYFPNGYYEPATRSNSIKVGPQIDLKGTLDKDANKVIAKWTQSSGNLYSKCWIGLYEKSEPNNSNYLAWEHAGKPSSEVFFDAPFKPREYELRFFTNSYVDVARSQPIRIDGKDSISAKYENGNIIVKLDVVTIDPKSESGWLGVYFTHEKDNRQWRRYKYFNTRIGDCQFKAPRTPGEYQVRMFANKTYDMILESNSFVIPAPPASI